MNLTGGPASAQLVLIFCPGRNGEIVNPMYTGFLVVLGIVILLVNSIFLAIIHRCDKIPKTIKILYCSQIVCDVISGSSLSVVTLPFGFREKCKFVNSLQVISSMASMLSLTALSLYQSRVLMFPYTKPRVHNVVLVVITLWTISVAEIIILNMRILPLPKKSLVAAVDIFHGSVFCASVLAILGSSAYMHCLAMKHVRQVECTTGARRVIHGYKMFKVTRTVLSSLLTYIFTVTPFYVAFFYVLITADRIPTASFVCFYVGKSAGILIPVCCVCNNMNMYKSFLQICCRCSKSLARRAGDIHREEINLPPV